MKTNVLWEQYQHYTKDVTDHSRKLAFATAAICWFFKTPQVTFPKPVLWSLIFVVGFFFLDVLQSLSGALLIRWFTRSQEKKMWKEKKTIEDEVLKPNWIDYPAFTLFLLKMLLLFASFACLCYEFNARLHP